MKERALLSAPPTAPGARPRRDAVLNLVSKPLATAALALASACSVGPRYTAPATPENLPDIVGGEAPPADTPLSAVTTEEVDLSAWWAQFHDPVLDDLIARARAGNLDRQTAASRVREARAAARQARAALFPTLSGSAGADRFRLSENVNVGTGGGMGQGQGQGPIETDVYMLGLQGSYTVDLFGANRAAARAARERAEAQAWTARDTEVSITSEVARTYFALRAGQGRLTVLAANARAQTELLNILAVRARGGLTNEVDASQQRSQLALTQAEIPPTEAEIAANRHQLELLLGVEPGALGHALDPRSVPASGLRKAPGTNTPADPDPLADFGLPSIPPHVPVGLPSTLLQRRPDIRAAERQLAASVSNVDRATALLYPQIQLTGLASLVSSSLSTLLEWSSRSLIGLASVSAPLFDGGSRQAVKTQAEEQAEQARLNYQKTVLTAFSQTADALARYGADQRQLEVLRAGTLDARRAARLNRAQYRGGLTNLTATLQAQALALQAEDQLAQAEGQLFEDLVGLYRALGGGWELDSKDTSH